MSAYLYAIIAAGGSAPDCSGLRDAPLRTVSTAELAAVVSAADPRWNLGTEADLWQHEQVVEALMHGGDVLPARFGTALDDDEQVRELLTERAEALKDALGRVAGSLEIAVRAALATGSGERAPEVATGTEYLEQARRRQELAGRLSERLVSSLGPVARARRVGLPDAKHVVKSAWLVDRERLGEFLDTAMKLNADTDFAELVCTGPWPPYSFVSREADR